jgi:hypothetical protein
VDFKNQTSLGRMKNPPNKYSGMMTSGVSAPAMAAVREAVAMTIPIAYPAYATLIPVSKKLMKRKEEMRQKIVRKKKANIFPEY